MKINKIFIFEDETEYLDFIMYLEKQVKEQSETETTSGEPERNRL